MHLCTDLWCHEINSGYSSLFFFFFFLCHYQNVKIVALLQCRWCGLGFKASVRSQKIPSGSIWFRSIALCADNGSAAWTSCRRRQHPEVPAGSAPSDLQHPHCPPSLRRASGIRVWAWQQPAYSCLNWQRGVGMSKAKLALWMHANKFYECYHIKVFAKQNETKPFLGVCSFMCLMASW